MGKAPKRSPASAADAASEDLRKVNLALQGGGAHGAFAWGVMDKLLEDGRIVVEGISGTSAGSMNAVVFAYGMIRGNDGAREALHNFWKAISDAGTMHSPLKATPLEEMLFGHDLEYTMANQFFTWMTHSFSPYQLNPFNFNPLRDVLVSQVDFDELKRSAKTKLFLSTTNVRSGKAKIFNTEAITADVVLASACLPYLFQAVEVNGEHFWDGGFMGNPVLYPLFYHTESRDVIIVHINPIERKDVPTSSPAIFNRINEITFNSSLIKELRAVHFVQNLMDRGWLKDEFKARMKYVLVHSIRSDDVLDDLSVTTKFASDWKFLTMLRDRGRDHTTSWLEKNFDSLGVRSSVDLQKEFL